MTPLSFLQVPMPIDATFQARRFTCLIRVTSPLKTIPRKSPNSSWSSWRGSSDAAPATRPDCKMHEISNQPRVRPMGTITTKDGTEIYYKDWGKGQPIVFHHGWPLSADDWDNQMIFFLSKGFRVVAHDRRGHGRSSQTDYGNDMDTYAADVAAVVKHLNLKDA